MNTPASTEPPAEDATVARAEACVRRAGALTVGDLLRVQAMRTPNAPAVTEDDRTLSYAAFNLRVNRAANALGTFGASRGTRVAILSENRTEYVELEFACAKIGVIACALNWRLADPELAHCIRLVAPVLIVVSPRFAPALARIDHGVAGVLSLGAAYESALAYAATAEPRCDVDLEDGLLVLYTSGTTGLPKGALISHRAEVARMHVCRQEFGLAEGDGFIAWPPMFHMASSDQMIACLCTGAQVFVVDGFDLEKILPLVARHRLWWLAILPGTIDRFCAAVVASGITPKGIDRLGAMADLVPPQQIAEVTALLLSAVCQHVRFD